MRNFSKGIGALSLWVALTLPLKAGAVTAADWIYVCGMTIAMAAVSFAEDPYVTPVPLRKAKGSLRGIRWVKDRLQGLYTGSKWSPYGKVDIQVGRRRIDRLSPDGRMVSTIGVFGVRSLIIDILPETERQSDELTEVVAELQAHLPELRVASFPFGGVRLVLPQLSLQSHEPTLLFNRLF